ncbi:MAG: hypothetical protein NC184_06940, partial [Roseburia sp.]|nr:hypothetical protein [Roseburia sp.]
MLFIAIIIASCAKHRKRKIVRFCRLRPIIKSLFVVLEKRAWLSEEVKRKSEKVRRFDRSTLRRIAWISPRALLRNAW